RSSSASSARAAGTQRIHPERTWWLSRTFAIKGGLAGAAVYVSYDQGLLGSGTEGAEHQTPLGSVIPLPPIAALLSFFLSFSLQLPPVPTLDFSPSDSWNKGVHTLMSALSVAPSRACEYTAQGWNYLKDLVK
uniref:MICOS complex subunit MIC13 n=1 Tax=Coturnix japonica TaxID=93934 RepID=A0A8C2TH25_COTJA